MTKKEMEKIFDFLEKEMNKQKLFYFKYINDFQITAHIKENGHIFAMFYPQKILKALEEWENNEIK